MQETGNDSDKTFLIKQGLSSWTIFGWKFKPIKSFQDLEDQWSFPRCKYRVSRVDLTDDSACWSAGRQTRAGRSTRPSSRDALSFVVVQRSYFSNVKVSSSDSRFVVNGIKPSTGHLKHMFSGERSKGTRPGPMQTSSRKVPIEAVVRRVNCRMVDSPMYENNRENSAPISTSSSLSSLGPDPPSIVLWDTLLRDTLAVRVVLDRGRDSSAQSVQHLSIPMRERHQRDEDNVRDWLALDLMTPLSSMGDEGEMGDRNGDDCNCRGISCGARRVLYLDTRLASQRRASLWRQATTRAWLLKALSWKERNSLGTKTRLDTNKSSRDALLHRIEQGGLSS
ncbi:hypothetical protein KCU85_g215, partial [Aureobasidium melanogenum]